MTHIFIYLSIACALLALVSFIVSDIRKHETPPEVGDVFIHINPGTSYDPSKESDPFIAYRIVEEVVGNKLKYRFLGVSLAGKRIDDLRWSEAKGFGQFDKKLED